MARSKQPDHKVRPTPEEVENQIEVLAEEFCRRYDFISIKEITQNQYNAFCRYIYKSIYQYNNLIRDNSNYNYNYQCLLDCLYIFIDMCYMYDKEISINAFCCMTGLPEERIAELYYQDIQFDYIYNGELLSYTTSVFYKILQQKREESLKNMLQNGKRNPVGVLAILNHSFNWSAQQVASETKARAEALTKSDIIGISYTPAESNKLEKL